MPKPIETILDTIDHCQCKGLNHCDDHWLLREICRSEAYLVRLQVAREKLDEHLHRRAISR
jgi:hypothetical protein